MRYCIIIIVLYARIVIPLFFGILLQYSAIYIAVVLPSLSYNLGSWFHSYGGIISYSANIIATV